MTNCEENSLLSIHDRRVNNKKKYELIKFDCSKEDDEYLKAYPELFTEYNPVNIEVMLNSSKE